MNEERLFIQDTIFDLESKVESYWDNPEDLSLVCRELFFRKTRRSRNLREKIVARLEELLRQSEVFKWPRTDAPQGEGNLLHGTFIYGVGLLGYLGYRVGENGAFDEERRDILRIVFNNEVPNLNSPEYMAEWGSPKTAVRLKKMAETIASNVRNAKRRDPSSLSLAIKEWESDLEYIRI
jgi:hypothetical protein